MSKKVFLAIALGLQAVAPVVAKETPGPASIELGEASAKLQLPAGYLFIDKEEAQKILEHQGSAGKGIVGAIVPSKSKDGNNFAVICRFDDCGYVNDDDAAKLNPDEILSSYKDGTKEQNEERKERGIPPIFVGGWAEKPRYEKSKHHVVWAIQSKDSEAADSAVTGVNYNTRILGRLGVLSMNLITDPDKLAENKPKVADLLQKTTFKSGFNYADYKPGKDKSAGFGIAGLILGGGAMAAAAKLGLFGWLWKWGLGLFLVFKKFAIVGIIAGVAMVKKFFKKSKGDSTNSTDSNA